MIREDLSDRLVHLTRGETYAAASKVLSQILTERKLIGGTGCIKGGYRCVCFSEAPVAKLGYLLAARSAHGVRYKPYGIMVSKDWLYQQGGRPVIYQPDADYSELPDSQRFRHVRYEPPDVDFTWEREWRICTASLPFEPTEVTVVVPNRAWVDRLKEEHRAMLSRRALLTHGFIGPRSVASFDWHFIALEDLGVPMPSDDGPTPVALPSSEDA